MKLGGILLAATFGGLFGVGACKEIMTSTTNDGATFGDHPAPKDNGDDTATQALAIISSKCISCHDGTHASWSGYTAQDFQSDGLITAGDPDHSVLYDNLQGVNGTMPRDDTISAADVAIIRAWISEMSE